MNPDEEYFDYCSKKYALKKMCGIARWTTCTKKTAMLEFFLTFFIELAQIVAFVLIRSLDGNDWDYLHKEEPVLTLYIEWDIAFLIIGCISIIVFMYLTYFVNFELYYGAAITFRCTKMLIINCYTFHIYSDVLHPMYYFLSDADEKDNHGNIYVTSRMQSVVYALYWIRNFDIFIMFLFCCCVIIQQTSEEKQRNIDGLKRVEDRRL